MKSLLIQNLKTPRYATEKAFLNANFSLAKSTYPFLFWLLPIVLFIGILDVNAFKYKEKAIIH